MTSKSRTFFVINIPVWIALILALTLAWFILDFFPKMLLWQSIFLGILCWQCLCMSIFLLLDYKRKYRLFLRLSEICQNQTRRKLAMRQVKQTICGFFIAQAVSFSINKDQMKLPN